MTGHVVVEADGGSRGNPGVAGYGAAVLDTGGAVLATRRGALGTATNNVAEYRGLIAGLDAAAELGARTVEVRMDSKLVVEQMSGRWRVKNAALQPLAAHAGRLVGRFDRVDFGWMPRERNKLADGLANEAMDGLAAGELEPEELSATPDAATPGAAEPVTPAVVNPEAAEPQEPASGPAGATATGPDGLFDVPAAATTGTPASWRGMTGTPLRLVLLRHGQTEHSVQRRYSGRGDPPLTETGQRQAKAAAARLAGFGEVTAVVSSPLRRAAQTAEAAAAATGAPLRFDDALVELDFGSWEGLSFTEAAARDPERHRDWLSDPSVATPGGESFDRVTQRVAATLDSLRAAAAGATVVLVSHVTPIKTLLRIALDAGPSVLYRLHLDLASVSLAEFYPDGNASVSLVNDTSHVR